MMPLPIFSQRIYAFAAAAVALTVATGLFLYQVQTPLAHAFGYGTAVSASPDTVYLSGNAAAASTTTETSMHEVHIAANGLTLLRGARVLSVSGNTIEVGMTWGSSDFTWTVRTGFSTKFLSAEGEKQSATDIHIGDSVTVTGKIAQGGGKPTIDADIVRN